jgi:hypothetical protein
MWRRGVGEAARALGLWAAYVALFLVGAAALGPKVDPAAFTPQEQVASAWMTPIVALLDLALMRAWIVRSRDRGPWLWAQAALVFYGVKTLSSTLETWWFVREAFVPREMLPGLFLMTVPLAVGWTGLAVWAWGPRAAAPAPAERGAGSLALRTLIAGAALYPTLFFLFGYLVAWRQPGVRAYYGGPETPLPLLQHLAVTFAEDPRVLPFEMARGVLWIALGWPVLRRTRGPWWVGGLLYAAMMAVLQNDVHLLPNPLMPREVRLWHLVETASSNFLFALGSAALLAPPGALRRLLHPAQEVGPERADRQLTPR